MMFKAIKFTTLGILLFLSSCQKKDIKKVSKNNLEIGCLHQNQIEEDIAGEKVFSPVSDYKAKQFVENINTKSGRKINGLQDCLDHKIAVDEGAGLESSINDSEIIGFGDPEINIEELAVQDSFPDECVIQELFQESLIKKSKNKAEDAQLVRQKEAKLSDIPVPINSEPLLKYFKSKTKKNEIILGYKNYMDASSVAKFYNQEMELFGWENVLFFDNIEKIMLFKKPSRFCLVSIRDINGRARFKKSSHDYKCEIIVFEKN